jgi:hypothetical protein
MPRGRRRKNPNEVLIKSAELIGWALGGIEREIGETRQRLSALTAQANQLRARVAGKIGRAASSVPAATEAPAAIDAPAPVARKRRKMSPEARKRMSEMMKKRWAERRKNAK